MRLRADQELRRELLLVSLSKQPDLDAAIQMATQLESYVLNGCDGQDATPSEAVTARGPHPSQIGAQPPRQPYHPLCNGMVPGAGAAPAEGQVPEAADSFRAPPAADGDRDNDRPRKLRWSTEDDRQLQQFWQAGRPLEDIAEVLGRTVPSLYSRARALGLPKRGNPQEISKSTSPCEAGKVNGGGAEDQSQDEPEEDPGLPQKSPGRAAGHEDSSYSSSHDPTQASGGKRSAKTGSAATRKATAARSSASQSSPAGTRRPPFFVDPIVQFLRSRDYSVIHVGGGNFQLDGRRVLTAEELWEKANRVRMSLGQPPFQSDAHHATG